MHCSNRNMHLSCHVFCNNENIILNTFYISSLKLSCRVVGNFKRLLILEIHCEDFVFCFGFVLHLTFIALPGTKEEGRLNPCGKVKRDLITCHLHDSALFIFHFLSGKKHKIMNWLCSLCSPTHFLSLTWKYFYKMHNLADPFSVW